MGLSVALVNYKPCLGVEVGGPATPFTLLSLQLEDGVIETERSCSGSGATAELPNCAAATAEKRIKEH